MSIEIRSNAIDFRYRLRSTVWPSLDYTIPNDNAVRRAPVARARGIVYPSTNKRPLRINHSAWSSCILKRPRLLFAANDEQMIIYRKPFKNNRPPPRRRLFMIPRTISFLYPYTRGIQYAFVCLFFFFNNVQFNMKQLP